jgi:hypothetical protein
MKITFNILALSCLIAIASCKKGGDDFEPPVVTPDKFAFKVDGVRDTSLERSGEVRLNLNVRLLSGKTEVITLGAADLPKGMKVTYSKAIGEPPFITQMVITTDRVLEGSYPIYVTDTTRFKDVQQQKMTVKIKPYSNMAVAYKGQFYEKRKCTSDSMSYPVFIEPAEKFINRITIKGFWTKVWSTVVYADLVPESKTITVPAQVIDGLTYSGLGTFNDDEIVINYTVKDSSGLVNETCTAVFTR